MKRHIQWKYILAVVVVLVLVFLVMDLNQRLDTKNRLANQVATVRVEGTHVMQTQVALVTQVAYATSEAAVEAYAYDVGMGGDGETLIQMLPDPQATPIPAQFPGAADVPQVSSWQVWLELFFGD